jgi:adenylate cyclase
LQAKNAQQNLFIGGAILMLLLTGSIYTGLKRTAKEKKKSDNLLHNILPIEVAAELKNNGTSRAKQFTNTTVLFTDFVNFTSISENMQPEELVATIDFFFKAFDEIIERNGLEKIKTIGDAYMAVGGLPNEDPNHALNATKAAIEICDWIQQQKKNGGKFDIRIGLSSGPVVAGIVGSKKFQYDIWGDTVNTASRIESNSEAGKVNISETTYQLVKENFTCTHRGKINVKGKGEIDMYFVNRSFSAG